MASADYHSGILVLLATPPQAETTADGLVVGCCMLGAGWVVPRWPWDNGGRHGQEVLLAAHFVSVLCVVLHVRHRRRDRK